MLDVAGTSLDAGDRELLRHPLVGGLILFSRNYAEPDQLRALVGEVRAARPDILIAVDYEGGRVQRFREGFTRIPAMRRLGELYDRDPERALTSSRICGWLIAAELGACDIDLSFAPVLDLDGGVSEVIGDRAFHSDPDCATELAHAFTEGMQAMGMAPTGKHFPGHGQVAPDSHHELPVDERPVAELQRDLQPFRTLIEAGLPSIMMAHIRFTAVDTLPASLSRVWVNDWLRGEWDYQGAVFTDDLNMGGAAVIGDELTRAELALDAGCDMLPLCNNRAGVELLLDGLRAEPDRQSGLRLQRLRLKPVATAGLVDNAAWRDARQALEIFNV